MIIDRYQSIGEINARNFEQIALGLKEVHLACRYVYLAGYADALDPFFGREVLVECCHFMLSVAAGSETLEPWMWWLV